MVGKDTKVTRIFLADDDEEDRLLFQEALSEVFSDVELIQSYDGENLMETLSQRVPPAPDAIFLDLNMPRKNGFECLAAIKENEKYRDIPVIIFSTTAQPDSVNITYAFGASCYFSKPNSFQLLKTGLTVLLKKDWKTIGRPPLGEYVFSLR
jgi:CheY-like chemotaxis protein